MTLKAHSDRGKDYYYYVILQIFGKKSLENLRFFRIIQLVNRKGETRIHVFGTLNPAFFL